jgi:cytochrome c biogenesis protein CcmG, thiol:disulfide interchange protein DsbE
MAEARFGVCSGKLGPSRYYKEVRRQFFPALLLATAALLSGCNRGDHPSEIGKLAPDFSITDGSRTVSLRDYRGKLVVLNFWATWCAPCVEEIPSLNELQRQMPQVVVLGISIDEDAQAYRQFLAQHPVDFLTIREGDRDTSSRYGTVLFPESYIIDQHGVIRRKFVNSQDWVTPEILEYLARLESNPSSQRAALTAGS